MFEARFPSLRFFCDILEAIRAVTDEATFRVGAQGVKLTAMDPSHVTLINLELEKEIFNEYTCNGDVEFTVSILDMIKMLKGVRADSDFTLRLEDKTVNINVKHEGGSENSLTLHTLESIASKIPLPALRFDASAVADSASVVKAVKTCQTFGSTTRISIAKPYISFTSKSESGRAEVKLSAEEVDGEASASFNASYLEKITRAASKISNKNRLELSTNKPLKISCTIPSGKLEYLIAPIIQSIHTIEMTPTAAKHWNNVDTTFFFLASPA